jgi:hypothetical protein
MEKLRAVLLHVRQTRGTSGQDTSEETDEGQAAGQNKAPSEPFRRMQQKLNNCIRHHQEIKR